MRPYTISHMMMSVDGRIDCDMTEQIDTTDAYYEALDSLGCPSMLMGRVTMQMHYALPETFAAADATPVGRTAFHKAADGTGGYVVGTDTHGRLCWPSAEADGRPLLVVVSEACPQAYVDALTAQGISWLAAGADTIDWPRAMETLRTEFGVERLAVTGGGHINGALLAAGLLDEVSVMIGPGIDGRSGMTAVFDGIDDPSRPATLLSLRSVERVNEGTVWLRYTTAGRKG